MRKDAPFSDADEELNSMTSLIKVSKLAVPQRESGTLATLNSAPVKRSSDNQEEIIIHKKSKTDQ